MDDIFDALLDKSIDDLADLPEFKVPDTCMYKLLMTTEGKAINEKPAVVAHFTVAELLELADDSVPENERAKNGDKFDIAFILKDKEGNDSEIAWGKLKQLTAPFSEHFEEKNLRTLLKEKLNTAVSITAKVTKKQRKDDKDKYQADVTDIVID